MYTLREITEDGAKKEYPCQSYEEARKLLDKKAEADKALLLESDTWAEIKHGEERYSRVTNESQKWYILDIVEG